MTGNPWSMPWNVNYTKKKLSDSERAMASRMMEPIRNKQRAELNERINQRDKEREEMIRAIEQNPHVEVLATEKGVFKIEEPALLPTALIPIDTKEDRSKLWENYIRHVTGVVNGPNRLYTNRGMDNLVVILVVNQIQMSNLISPRTYLTLEKYNPCYALEISVSKKIGIPIRPDNFSAKIIFRLEERSFSNFKVDTSTLPKPDLSSIYKSISKGLVPNANRDIDTKYNFRVLLVSSDCIPKNDDVTDLTRERNYGEIISRLMEYSTDLYKEQLQGGTHKFMIHYTEQNKEGFAQEIKRILENNWCNTIETPSTIDNMSERDKLKLCIEDSKKRTGFKKRYGKENTAPHAEGGRKKTKRYKKRSRKRSKKRNTR